MSKLNLERLRSNVLDSGGREEKVEVNQRHLIDKILARYSAEYVLYRELMQNADDALSTKIEIHFHSTETEKSKRYPDLSTTCNKITFKNNGIAFRPEDWERLKRIAEGNPDEQKIGAFGVGFYSLFSVCENPFVFSGAECMAFYFKGDQLFARRAPVPEDERDDWTVFLMDMREPLEMPALDHFAKFLTTSMGFTANLREISVYFDQHRIFSVRKQTEDPRPMPVDSRKVQTTSPSKMFTIAGADMRKIQLNAEIFQPPSIFAPLAGLLSSRPKPTITGDNDLPMERGSMFLRVVSADLNVQVSANIVREMERSTKKKPPKQTKFQLVYTNKEELDASENTMDVFRDLVPFPKQGRVFIGFPTHQTTGCCCHMAARFIPTVERESIDFADRYLSIWNKDLLSVGGLLCRIVYNDDMDQVESLYQGLVGDEQLVDKTKPLSEAKEMLEQRAAHTLLSFTFHPSTPSPIVSAVQQERFFQSSRIPLRIMTSHGVQPATVTRTLPDDGFTLASPRLSELINTFVKSIPTLSAVIELKCKDSIRKLQTAGLLEPLGMADVLKELDTRSLTSAEMVACLKWWIECNRQNPLIPQSTLQQLGSTRSKFFSAAVMTCSDDRLLQLSSAQWWVNPKVIALDMAVPDTTLPFAVSKAFLPQDLAQFFGLSELSILTWSKFIANDSQLQISPGFAEKVLSIVSRGYQHLSLSAQQELVTVFSSKTCIPTRYGMKLPGEAYFASVNLFDDLPTTHFQQPKHIHESMLTALGVRKHVDLQMIFDRLLSDGSWSHVELIKYLTTVKDTLSKLEVRRLQQTAIFTKEGEEPKTKTGKRPSGKLDDQGKPIMESVTKQVYVRYKASDLYIPTDTLRQLQLPLLDWKSLRWRASSDEAQFMRSLGLKSHPAFEDLLVIATPASNQNTALRQRALTYLIDQHEHYHSAYSASLSSIQHAFLPCRDGKTFVAPKDCFTNRDVALLGFQVLHDDLLGIKDRLCVAENPSTERLLIAFQQHLSTDATAMRPIFEFMATQMGRFDQAIWNRLRELKCIPAAAKSQGSKSASSMTLVTPSDCYFESSTESTLHKELFLYVDFGQVANAFLRSCGVKNEPTTLELASMLVKDPQRFWDLCGGGEGYLSILRQMAAQLHQLKSNAALFRALRTTACLVGTKRSHPSNINHPDDADGKDHAPGASEDRQDDEFVQYQLAVASDIFINDDTMGQHIFSPFSAPMEPLLEEFYAALGSDRLSNQIKESYSYRGVVDATDRSKNIMNMILQRTPIILYQMKHDYPQRSHEQRYDATYVRRNLKVIQAQDLRINRVFKHTGESNVQPVTACAEKSKFIIYVSHAGDIDYYDVANALCYLLFSRVRFNDAIIAERYLTASLTNLRRKGVPVDRILSIKKQVDPTATAAPPSLTASGQSTPAPSSGTATPATPPPLPKDALSSSQMDALAKRVQDVFGDCDRGYIRQLLAQQPDNHAERVIERLLHEDFPKQQQVQQKSQSDPQPEANASDSGRLLDRLWSWGKAKQPTLPLPEPVATQDDRSGTSAPAGQPSPTATITPNYTSSIKQNLKRAIHSCKPYTGQQMFSPPTINNVVESTQYCDATPGQNLRHIGKVKDIECYAHRDVHPDMVVVQYRQGLCDFASLVTTLAQVFDLKLNTLHLFYDAEGSTIAFNRSGSLFLNLRFYLALHTQGSQGAQDPAKVADALIYWFMTVCHELAHNFVAEHSSEHEFYFSSFAEVYMLRLLPHLSPSSTPLATKPDLLS
ncbi:hypothetical protein DM01DRAFT_1404308 [Hesseltinella vesiculosa]|uniref:CUE domain-containing protein n=1 Tax=Hesseltinella vesiculosa TaxID=101127 RepID=A0A1X2GU36_9FUNG|nr:hypothetical protein DM01DRAFT_1404308 [Hesseltinella vesiculosa]